MVYHSRFRAQGFECWVQGVGRLRVEGLGFRVLGLREGFGIEQLGY
jgi:hypothetical protein